MISIVLYGRNDSYGYNLHKRAALSLNCMAELLDDPDDEILFVDYNTPDDFPTFPEAIQDTLTGKAKARLRILRARPSVHARFKHKTHLQALEPVSRNIAVRRSNPANRWILSTNTDMIFVPRNGQSLSAIVRDLPKGYFGIPRFEIPESLWETLDRYDAAGTIETVGAWGWRFHLNEIVHGAPTIKFDAPGDFQLIDRADLFRIDGFNEEMLLGWHVDSNLCKRLFMLYGTVGDLSDRLFGYHCDHTRQVTPAHKRTAVENSIAEFFDGVTRSEIPNQAKNWGCADAEIEYIRLDVASSHEYLRSLHAAVKMPMVEPSSLAYVRDSHDMVGYDPQHVLPYLMDVLSSAPRDWNVAWFGVHKAMFALFRVAWRAMGFTGRILMLPTASGTLLDEADEAVTEGDLSAVLSAADVFIVDFSGKHGQALSIASDGSGSEDIRSLLLNFCAVIEVERISLEQARTAPRRIIAVNAIHNRFESLVRGHIEFARSPISGRLRHGYALPAPKEPTPWLGLMTLKRAAQRVGSHVRSRPRVRGHLISGPHLTLFPGQYILQIDIQPGRPSFPFGWVYWLFAPFLGGWFSKAPTSTADSTAKARSVPVVGRDKWKKSGAVAVEIRNGSRVLSRKSLSRFELLMRRHHYFKFSVTRSDFDSLELPELNVRVWTAGYMGLVIRALDMQLENSQSLAGNIE